MSDEKAKGFFKDAVSWSLPEITGAVNNQKIKPEKNIDLEDVRQFEARIKKQIAAIKSKEENPAYLTVKQIEDIQKQAYDEAYKNGTKDSEKYIQEQLQTERNLLKTKAQQLEKCFNTLSAPLQTIDLEIEQELTDMIFYFCKQILAHELKTDPAHILHLIQQAINRLPVAKRQVQIKLNPADISLLEQSEINITDQDWKLEADAGLAAGGCQIKTENASMDLSLENRLKELTDQLFAGLKKPDSILPESDEINQTDELNNENDDA